MPAALDTIYTGTNSKTAGTSLTCPAITEAAGVLIVLSLAFDNTGTSTPTISTLTKPAGETNSWSIAYASSATATSGSGVRTAMAYILTTTSWSAFAPVATFSASITAKCCAAASYTGVSTTVRGSINSAAAASTLATFSAGTATAGDFVICARGFEGTASQGTETVSPTPTNGGWSTWGASAATSGSSAATNVNTYVFGYEAAAGSQTSSASAPGNDNGVISVILVPAGTNLSPTGIASAETFGTAAISTTITGTPTGIGSAEAFGTAVVSTGGSAQTITPSGIASAEAFGTAVRTSTITLTPTGVASAEAFGAPVISTAITLTPTALGSAEAFGAPVISSTVTLTPTAIASAEAFGTATTGNVLNIVPNAIDTVEAFGTPVINTTVDLGPTGIASAEAFGTPVYTPPSQVGTAKVGTPAANTVAATSIAVAYPAGIAADDFAVIFLTISSADESASPPAGWTDYASFDTGSNTTPTLRLYTKKLTGSESGTVSCTTPNVTSQAVMIAWPGVDTTTPLDVAFNVTTLEFERTAANLTFPMPGDTVVTTGAKAITAAAQNTAVGTWSAPSVGTELVDVAATTPKLGVFESDNLNAGASTAVTLNSTSSSRGVSIQIILRPATGAPASQTITPTGFDASGASTATVSDDFNRADGGLGSNWTTYGDLAISGNALIEAVANPSAARHVTIPAGPGMFAQMAWKTINSGVSVFGGPAVMMPPLGTHGTTGSFYYLSISGTGHTVMAIRKKDAGASTTSVVGTTATITAPTAGDMLKIVYEDSTGDLVGYINNVELIRRNRTLNDLQETDTRGVGIFLANQFAGTGDSFDDWSGGDTATTTPFGTPTVSYGAGGQTLTPTGIASAEAFGTSVISSTVTLTPTAISSSEVFGVATLAATVTMTPTGIPSAEGIGTPVLGAIVSLSPTGIGSGETFGTPVLSSTVTLTPTGIASAETFGTPVRTSTITLTPTGIATAEAFGTASLSSVTTMVPVGIVTAEAFGTPVLGGVVTLSPTGIPTGETFGTPAVSVGGVILSPTGIASAQAFGTAVISSTVTLTPTGIVSAEAFGTPVRTSTITISPTGIVSLEAFGNPILAASITLTPTGIASAQAFGTAVISTAITLTPTGIASLEAFGTTVIATTVTISPTGIASAQAFGTAVITTGLTMLPTGIASAQAFGTAVITSAVTLVPAGIASSEAFGTPRQNWNLYPVGIASEEAFGFPVWQIPGFMGWGIPI